MPLIRYDGGVDTVGLSEHAPGAYAEQLLVQESLMLAVPNGLPAGGPSPPARARLHEPHPARSARTGLALMAGALRQGLA